MMLQTSDRSGVLERLEKWEKQNRRMKQVGAFLVVLAACFILMGQAAPRKSETTEIIGTQFVLIDNNGERRGSFGVVGGGVSLNLFDPSGKIRASLSVFPDGTPQLTLADVNGNARAMLSENPDGGMQLGFADANEKPRAAFSERTLVLQDEEGFETRIGSTDSITPRTGETHKTSAASVILLDKEGKVLWKAP